LLLLLLRDRRARRHRREQGEREHPLGPTTHDGPPRFLLTADHAPAARARQGRRIAPARCRQPGGVVVSGTAYDQLHGKLDLTLDFAGEQRVKNIERLVRAYRFRLDGTRPVASAEVVGFRCP
jgi:hypothetical protein